MRDPGLTEAIRAAGGVSELARQLGISQPSVSNWTRVPAERVIAVEVATGVGLGGWPNVAVTWTVAEAVAVAAVGDGGGLSERQPANTR